MDRVASEWGIRLLTRVRSHPTWRHASTVMWIPLIEVAELPMMRKGMLGIKARAEDLNLRLLDEEQATRRSDAQ